MANFDAAFEDFVRDIVDRFANSEMPTLPWEHVTCLDIPDANPTAIGVQVYTTAEMSTKQYPSHSSLFEREYSQIRQLPTLFPLLTAVQSDEAISSVIFSRWQVPPPPNTDVQVEDLLRKLIDSILPAYCVNAGGVRFAADALKSVITAIKEDAAATEQVVLHLFPFTLIQFNSQKIELEPGVSLRPWTSEEADSWLNSAQDPSIFQRVGVICSTRWLIEIAEHYPKKAEVPYTVAEGIARRVQRLLRLLSGLPVQFILMHQRAPRFLSPWSAIVWERRHDYDDRQCNWGEGEARRLIRLWRTLANNEGMQLALRRWSAGLDRPDDEDRLIDFWIGLESLFTPDSTSELRFRASMRIAAFLGNTGEERSAIYKDVQHSYDWRSTIVHGSDKKAMTKLAKKGSLDSITHKTGEYLRMALLSVLEESKSLAPVKLDELLLRGELAASRSQEEEIDS